MKIYEVLVEAGREEHIARHHITIAEVEQVVFGELAFIRRTRDERYLVIGQTDAGRYVSVILAPRGKGAYALITARDADDKERRAYQHHRGH
jgi:uncharacterized DUF497 family protein